MRARVKRTTRKNARAAARFAVCGFACALPLAAFARPAAFSIGLEAQPTALVYAVRTIAFVLAACLLFAGRRMPRLTLGVFFLSAGFALSWVRLSPASYAATAGACFVAMAIGLAIYLFLPRLALVMASFWPLPALYVAWLYFSGSFSVSRPVLVALAVLGAVLGGLFPRFSTGLVAGATGTVLTAAAWTQEPRFWPMAVLFLTCLLWQTLLLDRLLPPPPAWPVRREERRRTQRARWAGSAAWGALFLVAALVLGAILAPMPLSSQEPYAGRLEALRKEGALDRPGFTLSPQDGYYLFGRPVAGALVGRSYGSWNRLAVLAVGRSPIPAIHAMRAVKEPGELAKMRRAADITSRAFDSVAPLIRPGVSESDLELAVLDAFRRDGATGLAFRPVIGAGPNAVLPHHVTDGTILESGFVVIDIGCSYDHYASDMTRTFVVGGTPTKAEKRLLDVVARAKTAAVATLRDGSRLSIADHAARQVIRKAGFGPYFVHFIGHDVGLSVHDPSPDRLRAGMVLTIEPGVYIPKGAAVDPAYWNLGVRIEDTYLVTKTGAEALTHYPQVPPGTSPQPSTPPANSPIPSSGS